jgi:hypothetical protein
MIKEFLFLKFREEIIDNITGIKIIIIMSQSQDGG